MVAHFPVDFECLLLMATTVAVLAMGLAMAGTDMADNRSFGSILNNDGNNILFGLSRDKATVEEYRKGVSHLLEAKPGVLAQSIGQPDPVFYRSKVATPWDKYRGGEVDGQAMKALAVAGTDPLALTIDVCREQGVLAVASFRMNAEDLHAEELSSYDFGRQNEHLRIGNQNCLDPIHPVVYEHRMEIFREVICDYDLDGIEFDFKRWIFMVSDPLENHVVLTRMVRDMRTILDEVARERGRDRLLLGVRVEPIISGDFDKTDFPGAQGPPWNRSCEASGLDIGAWVDEELVDYICPSHFWPCWPGLPDTAPFAALVEGKNVGIYPTIWPVPAWLDEDVPPIERDNLDLMRRYKDELCEIVLQAYAEGADGMSSYNWLPHHQHGMLPYPMRPNWGDGNKALQMHIHAVMSDHAAVKAYAASDLLLEGDS